MCIRDRGKRKKVRIQTNLACSPSTLIPVHAYSPSTLILCPRLFSIHACSPLSLILQFVSLCIFFVMYLGRPLCTHVCLAEPEGYLWTGVPGCPTCKANNGDDHEDDNDEGDDDDKNLGCRRNSWMPAKISAASENLGHRRKSRPPAKISDVGENLGRWRKSRAQAKILVASENIGHWRLQANI